MFYPRFEIGCRRQTFWPSYYYCDVTPFAQVQDFRRNILSVCEDAVMERTASDRSMVLYSYPPNLGEAGRDEIDGVELIEVDVCYTTSDGRLNKTLLNVCEDKLCISYMHV